MRPALGKGLNALISDEIAASVTAKPATSVREGVTTLPIRFIQSDPEQPRQKFDDKALAELTASIAQRGVLQPILVTQTGENAYQIIAGERRWRAAQLAGLTEIPAVVKGGNSSERFQMALIENVQREDLNPIELAQGFTRLVNQFTMTQEEVARVVGKDRAVVANTMRLLQLSPEMKQALVDGKISAGHGRALVALTDEGPRAELFNRIINEQLTVRAVENAVRQQKEIKVAGHVRQATPQKKAPEARAIEEDLQRTLARKVELQMSGADAKKGWVRLEFYSPEDLEHLISQLKRP